jgi:Na+/proline symporter
VLPIGVKGLVVAGMLAASMSTYSGYLLAWSSVISEDVIIPLRRRAIEPRTALLINRITILFLTVFIIVWGLFYVVPGATYFYLQMTANLFLAGTFWALVGGLHWKYSNSAGAYLGLILGGSATLLYFVSPNPSQSAGTIGVLSYVLALAGMAGGSLAASPLVSRAVRAAAGAGVAALTAGCALWFLRGGLPGLAWLEGWTLVLVVSSIVFTGLSAHAIFAGYGELRKTLRRMRG